MECNFVLYVGSKKLVKRKEFEQYNQRALNYKKFGGFKIAELML